jgi:hypothetical protein
MLLNMPYHCCTLPGTLVLLLLLLLLLGLTLWSIRAHLPLLDA